MESRLSILITGASSGIGAALARQAAKKFGKYGVDLTLCARRLDRLETLAAEIRTDRINVLPVQCDVTSRAELDPAVSAATKKFGKLDIVFANAGFGIVGDIEILSNDDFRRQFETNMYGVLNTIHSSLNELKKTKGRMVITGSVCSYISIPGNSAYSMSKMAVKGLADSLYYELLKYGISVTLICPGFVESEIREVDNNGIHHPGTGERVFGWLVMSADRAARKIISAAIARKREVVITLHGKILVWFFRYLPWFFVFLIKTFGLRSRQEPTTK